MSVKFLNRDEAPISAKVWEAIDATVVGAAKMQMSARRILAVEGPFGLGLKLLPGNEESVQEKAVSDQVCLSASGAVPLVAIQAGFRLSGRDIAAFEEAGLPLNLGDVAAAAINCARQEDAVLFNGVKALGLLGLLGAKGTLHSALKAWDQPGKAAQDVIEAVNKLDAAGLHGPYALALAPDRFNLLFRLYPEGRLTELEHLKTIAADGVVKAPGLTGGILIATGKQFASIVVGQDLAAGFVGPQGTDYEFTVSETVALRLQQPAAVCALK